MKLQTLTLYETVNFITRFRDQLTARDSMDYLRLPKLSDWDSREVKCSSPSIIRIIKSRRMRWTGYVARMGEKRNAYRLLVGKPEGKRPLGRPRCRWVDTIRMDLGEVGWGDVDWIGLTKDGNRWRALVNSVLNLRFP
jgi:hypothetical protein